MTMTTKTLILASLMLAPVAAFLPQNRPLFGLDRSLSTVSFSTAVDTSTSTKPAATSFLSEETIQRAKKGSPIEKIKLEKDVTNAWVDVYEYARKIREGEMTWEEVEKAGLFSAAINTMNLVMTISYTLIRFRFLTQIWTIASSGLACFTVESALQDNL